ncbi:hypothetical protein A2U01_0089957, partial [Trifolium medium]|nr:hypothetical protein [Trifolium medium]
IVSKAARGAPDPARGAADLVYIRKTDFLFRGSKILG